MSAPPPHLSDEVSAFRRARRVPGMAVGLLSERSRSVWGFGSTASTPERAPDGSTVFEIGSVTKVFTAAVLARLSGQGRVALDEPVRGILAGRVRLPDWAGREVTLLHLATHTSTLPRASRRMRAKAFRSPANPYRDYTVDDLYADLAAFRPGEGLGRAFEYSNLGAGLLGHLLELRAGAGYEELVRELVCGPLGLADTVVTLDEGQRRRLAQGHFFGRPARLWDMPALAGAGALRSTADDLLAFLEANVGPAASPLQEALALTQAPRVRVSAELSVGLAWHRSALPDGGEAVWHRGETGGFRSFVGFVPPWRRGLVLLANASAGVDELGLELLGRLGPP